MHKLARFVFILTVLLTSPLCFAQDNPLPNPKAVVTSGKARFTVLTPQLIRMEWSDGGQFEDHASLVFLNRRLPVPAFKTGSDGAWLTITTDKLALRYKKDSGKFAPENLSIALRVNGKPVTWKPGTKDAGNLQGTIRTLDGVKGSAPLGEGLISRDGWVVVDDSERPLFDNSEWPWVMNRPAAEQDWYFFGYGHDYKQALGDYTKVAGKIPLPPRFAFGAWWSRYWAYTDAELKELVNEFEAHEVPLDVLVIDMDWHLTFGTRWWENKKDQAGESLGWTGYTWNPLYFPDPTAFLKWTHEHGLKATMNLHPASGVQPHEAAYPEMARAMGIDPATKKYVPFDITSKKFAENYLKILHYPLEKQGVDFWWLDFQQNQKSSINNLNNTWWLNYVHFTDKERRGERPLIFHRWGGLGNHRYQIGFSGDTVSVWESLAFQPYFTATAANVGYAYWSHDIGGHMPGAVSPELYTRWVQWGIFSPALRTHTTKNPESERRIWAYPVEYAETMRDAFVLRYAMIPYIYTEGRKTYDSGVAFLRPMYYDYPDAPEAYEFKDQYFFGDSMIVAPIITPADEQSGLATKSVWLPQGTWIEWFTGTVVQGPTNVDRGYAIDEIPVFVRAGAIIPMQPPMRHTGEKPVDPLILTFFPGANGETRVYDDAGDTLGYKKGEFAWTSVASKQNAGDTVLTISPMDGHYPGMLTERGYELRLANTLAPEAVSYAGKNVPYSGDAMLKAPSWHYDGATLTTIILLPKASTAQGVEVRVRAPQADTALMSGARGRLARLKRAVATMNQAWPKGTSPDMLLEAAQAASRMTYKPESARDELEKLNRDMPEVVKQIKAVEADPKLIQKATGLLAVPKQ